MSKTNPPELIFKGMLHWAGPMLMPILMLYFNEDITFNIINICLLYPIVLALSAKNAAFWISNFAVSAAGGIFSCSGLF